jgi:uncharacterized protein YkwD
MPRGRRIVPFCLVGVLTVSRCAAPSVAFWPEPPPLPPARGASRAGPSNAALEREVYDLVNRHRRARRLGPLMLDARISEQARGHSVDMATGRARFGHQGFEDRARALGRVMPVRRSAENVAVNQGYAAPASQAFEAWLASPGHRTNIEGTYDATGIGVARTRSGEIYFTQIFVAR